MSRPTPGTQSRDVSETGSTRRHLAVTGRPSLTPLQTDELLIHVDSTCGTGEQVLDFGDRVEGTNV